MQFEDKLKDQARCEYSQEAFNVEWEKFSL